ncbi:MAG: hypothetical protein U0264_03440 [Candidatus Kapaibacterium sp.]
MILSPNSHRRVCALMLAAMLGIFSTFPTFAQGRWTKSTILDDKGGSRFFQGVSINSTGTGIAVGYRAVGQLPVIFTTQDFGKSWRYSYQRMPMDKPLLSPSDTKANMAVVSKDTLLALCDNATLLLTTDGGNTWTQQTIPSMSVEIKQSWIRMFSGGKGVIITNPYSVYETNDGGFTWTPRTVDSLPFNPEYKADVYALQWFNENHWYLMSDHRTRNIGRYMLHETTDGGRTWSRSSVIPRTRITPYGDSSAMHSCMRFTDANHGWLLGVSSLNTTDNRWRDIVIATTDGGATWITQLDTVFTDALATSPFGIDDLYPLNNDTVYACGDGKVIVSTNGGQSWHGQPIEGNTMSKPIEAELIYATPYAKVMVTSGLFEPNGTMYYWNESTNQVNEDDSEVQQSTLTVVPQPVVNGYCQLTGGIADGTIVRLYSAIGEEVLRYDVYDSNQQMNVSALAAGVYTVIVQSPGTGDCRQAMLLIHE